MLRIIDSQKFKWPITSCQNKGNIQFDERFHGFLLLQDTGIKYFHVLYYSLVLSVHSIVALLHLKYS